MEKRWLAAVGLISLTIFLWDGLGMLRNALFPEHASLWRSIEVECISGQISWEVEEQLGDDPNDLVEYEGLMTALDKVRDLIDDGRAILDDAQYPVRYRASEADARFRQAAKISLWVSTRLRWVMQSHRHCRGDGKTQEI